MNRKLLILSLVLSFAVVCLNAAPVAADMFGGISGGGDALQKAFDDMTVKPVLGSSSIDVYNDALPDVGPGVHDSYWNNASPGSVSTMIIELAGFDSTNGFGIYDMADENAYLEIFNGNAVPGSTHTVYVMSDGGIYLDTPPGPGVTPNETFAGIYYGFYLDSSDGQILDEQDNVIGQGGLWYSDTDLNTDDLDHIYAYRGENDTIHMPGGWPDAKVTPSHYILAWEDLDSSKDYWCDYDYNDMVVLVESIIPVPVPTAVLLGILGLGVVGCKLRKYA